MSKPCDFINVLISSIYRNTKIFIPPNVDKFEYFKSMKIKTLKVYINDKVISDCFRFFSKLNEQQKTTIINEIVIEYEEICVMMIEKYPIISDNPLTQFLLNPPPIRIRNGSLNIIIPANRLFKCFAYNNPHLLKIINNGDICVFDMFANYAIDKIHYTEIEEYSGNTFIGEFLSFIVSSNNKNLYNRLKDHVNQIIRYYYNKFIMDAEIDEFMYFYNHFPNADFLILNYFIINPNYLLFKIGKGFTVVSKKFNEPYFPIFINEPIIQHKFIIPFINVNLSNHIVANTFRIIEHEKSLFIMFDFTERTVNIDIHKYLLFICRRYPQINPLLTKLLFVYYSRKLIDFQYDNLN